MDESNFEFLDAINIVSFLAQLKNMAEDERQTSYIRLVIQTIFKEINKLHQENDYIIKLLKEINEKEKRTEEIISGLYSK